MFNTSNRRNGSVTFFATMGLAIVVSLPGCSATKPTESKATSNTVKGGAIGALAGAAVGAAVSHNDRASGAAIGAVLGGGAGAALGYRKDRQEFELREKLKGSSVAVDVDGDAIKLTMPNSISFDSGNAELRAKFYPQLEAVADSLRNHPKTAIKISGFTDTKGNADQNRALSLDRAKAVARYLVATGIDAKRIEVRGMGPALPIAANDSAMGRAKNRRVELLIIAQPEAATS